MRRPVSAWLHTWTRPTADLRLRPLLWTLVGWQPFLACHVTDGDGGFLSQVERIYGNDLPHDVVLHVLAHTFYNRDDGYQKHDTDHHAEQSEEALQLLHSDLRQCKLYRLEKRHGLSDHG